METLFLHENDPVEITTENDTIVIKKTTRKHRAKKSLEERLEEFYQKPIDEILADDSLYSPAEYDWGKPAGKEVW
ncbi:MAG: AbrB family transcriptional regulator [Firmicutes bacterium]|nr:AbrB family transcriptional regulator [Bacillota bacterium]